MIEMIEIIDSLDSEVVAENRSRGVVSKVALFRAAVDKLVDEISLSLSIKLVGKLCD